MPADDLAVSVSSLSADSSALPAPPEVAFADAAPSRVLGVEMAAIPVYDDPDDGPTLGAGAAELLDEIDLDVFAAMEYAEMRGASGQMCRLPLVTGGLRELSNSSLREIVLIGVGRGSTGELRGAGAALARAARGRQAVSTSVAAGADDEALRAFVEGLVLASFTFTLRAGGPDPAPVGRVVLAATPARPDVLRRALTIAGAGWQARLLATLPSNFKDPAWMADQALAAAQRVGLEAKVWDEAQLAHEGFGGLTAVGRASVSPPRLVQLTYTPAAGARRRKSKHVVLVGKGITFDSGGLSIKPGESMVTMKRDMTGAGVVLSVMAALAELDVPVKVTGLLCLAENAVGSDALRPGDVVTHYGGRTTEVTNTDAEGRLVLADGLAYAVDRLKPDAIVDIATLTGGVKVALGLTLGGIFASDDALCGRIEDAGARAGEELWRLPLVEEYAASLKSQVADAINAPGGAPAITAALFLRPFTGGLPWAHLDIASVGDADKDRDEYTAGPTGFGARALLYWLERDASLSDVTG